jgi:hypothetical protein
VRRDFGTFNRPCLQVNISVEDIRRKDVIHDIIHHFNELSKLHHLEKPKVLSFRLVQNLIVHQFNLDIHLITVVR